MLWPVGEAEEMSVGNQYFIWWLQYKRWVSWVVLENKYAFVQQFCFSHSGRPLLVVLPIASLLTPTITVSLTGSISLVWDEQRTWSEAFSNGLPRCLRSVWTPSVWCRAMRYSWTHFQPSRAQSTCGKSYGHQVGNDHITLDDPEPNGGNTIIDNHSIPDMV